MPKAVSSVEAKNRLGSLLGYVADEGDEVIVESHGKPKAVIMSYAAYEQVRELREQRRRADALERLRALQHRVSERNSDLSFDEAEAIAEDLSQEALRRMADRGDIAFERDRP